jgi:hypothetical protein
MLTSKQYRDWATNELRLHILNDEKMYHRAMGIMNHKRYSAEGKARALKRAFKHFDTGKCRVGQYVQYRKLAESL